MVYMSFLLVVLSTRVLSMRSSVLGRSNALENCVLMSDVLYPRAMRSSLSVLSSCLRIWGSDMMRLYLRACE